MPEPPVHPHDFMGANAAHMDASGDHDKAVDYLKTKAQEFADAEKAYRKALSEKILHLRDEGMAVTAAGDVARGSAEVVELKHARDLAEGLKEAAIQNIWRHTADRRTLDHFIDWSKRAAFVGEQVGA